MTTAPWQKASFWSAAMYVIFALLNHFLGLGIDAEYMIALLLPILALVFGDAWVEVQKLKLEQLKYELQIRNK